MGGAEDRNVLTHISENGNNEQKIAVAPTALASFTNAEANEVASFKE
jgi:hypothetical protein